MLTIELCGKLADMSAREIKVSIPPAGVTIVELRRKVASAYPALAQLISSPRVRVCVNDAIVDDDDRTRIGDRVAFFPPVSGG